jgi:hypothetical protein
MTNMQGANERIARMTFASVYPHYLAKVERKGRTREELDAIIGWLTGFDSGALQTMIDGRIPFEEFFLKADLHPDAMLVTGLICGHRIEEIVNPLTRRVRCLDKLVDELAKGRPVEKIMNRKRP